jgi:hypothetical protein
MEDCKLPDEIETGPDFWSEETVNMLTEEQPYTAMAKARVVRTLALQAAARVALVESLINGYPTEATGPLCDMVATAGLPNGIAMFVSQASDLLSFALERATNLLDDLRGEAVVEEVNLLATSEGPPADSMLWKAGRIDSKAASLDYATAEIKHVLLTAAGSAMEGVARGEILPNVGAQLESAIFCLNSAIVNISDVGRSLQDSPSATMPISAGAPAHRKRGSKLLVATPGKRGDKK